MADRELKDYTEMSEDELNAELDQMIAEHERTGKPWQRLGEAARLIDRTIPISMRVPSKLLQSLKDEAARQEMPYQRLMLKILDAGVAELQGQEPVPTITVPIDAEVLRGGHVRLNVVPR